MASAFLVADQSFWQLIEGHIASQPSAHECTRPQFVNTRSLPAHYSLAQRASGVRMWHKKKPQQRCKLLRQRWLRGLDLNQRPSGYEPE